MAGLFGLFNYGKEGPGVAKNGPKKRAFVVFFEIYGRKFWKLAIASLLWVVTGLAVVTRGLADAGLTFITRNFSREKHAFIPEDFFTTIKKNWKIALPVGIINLLVTGVLCYNVFYYVTGLMPALLHPVANGQVPEPMTLTWFDNVIMAVTVLVFVTFTWMKYYIPFLMITFKLKLKQIYKNAFLFASVNLKVNLLISVVMLAVYALMGALLFQFPNVTMFVILGVLAVAVVPGFRSLLIQFCIFPCIKKLMIDPYYKENPDADKQARLDLNLDVEETEEEKAESQPVFVDTLPQPEPEDKTPGRALPKQYNEKEMRRFNRQVQSRNQTDDDDDTI